MAKDKTLHGLITVVLLQLCCAMARSSNVKDGNKFTRDTIFKVRNAANKETNLPDFNMLQIVHPEKLSFRFSLSFSGMTN